MDQADERTPVIVAIGELADRTPSVEQSLEPVELMAAALRIAEAEAPGVLSAIDSLELVAQMTWRYENPVGLLCEKLEISPGRVLNASMGGDTPVRLLHEAALRICRGESQVSAFVGGEAISALRKARKEKARLDWTPIVSADRAAAVDFAELPIRRASKKLCVTAPVHIYPLYENAFQAARGQTPAEARDLSAALWEQYAEVAAQNPVAWLRDAPSADEIGTPGSRNRMVAFPYPKLMVANPVVNQAAAVVIASKAWAKSAGIPESRLIYIWGGAAAQEPGDYLERDRYDGSSAQSAVLSRAVAIAGGDPERFDLAETYSCFPIVPKMALENVGLRADVAPTVAGGLTFFGGPINNYMAHGICAMVKRLRAGAGNLGLLYGQGGVVTKHHSVVISGEPSPVPLSEDYSVQVLADAARGPVPEFIEDYAGPATIETYTVIYSAKGSVIHGVVVLRNPAGQRLLAKVRRDDETSIAILTSLEANAIGTSGQVRTDAFGATVWESAARPSLPDRTLKYCIVERQGPVTIVTINRPEAMNALHPLANEELSEVFDAFQADPDQWIAIVTGAGDKAFSSGNDLKFTAELMSEGLAVETPRRGFGGLTARWDLTKPVIAAVNGVAMGGGFEIALACDLVVASEEAVFALPEPRVGLAALAGGLLRLPRQVGHKHAMGMILTGRRVTAAEGLALGFVNEVVPKGEVLNAARRWADAILECSPMSVRASKQAVLRGLDEPDLQTAYKSQNRYPAMGDLFRSADLREGPLAFAQKRPPAWKGH